MQFEIYCVNRGPRSYLGCELCNNCPRGDQKGCCHYSPSFSLPDLVYFFRHHKSFLQEILNMQGIVLEENRLVVASVEKEQGKTCRFHAANGCRLHPEMRDTVCRLYVCPGIGLWSEAGLLPWQNFFGALVQQEYELQELMAGQLKGEGLTLAENTWQAVAFLTRLNAGRLESDKTGLLNNQRELNLAAFPSKLVKKITRQISRTDWVV